MPPNATATSSAAAPGTTTKATTAATTSSSSNPAGGDWSGGKGVLPGREAFGPLFLMGTTPAFAVVFVHLLKDLGGDWKLLLGRFCSDGFLATLQESWPTPWDLQAWQMIVSFAALQLLLMKCVPGKTIEATPTPTGHVPRYTANGFQCYCITMGLVVGLYWTGLWNPASIYLKFGEIISSMNVFALVFCIVLLVKGHVAPSTADSGSNGSWIVDFYWGMELYPRFTPWFDVKVWTNCRMGMMFWAVALVGYCCRNVDVNMETLNAATETTKIDGTDVEITSMGNEDAIRDFEETTLFGVSYPLLVSCALQWIYITKFFIWESGYMKSMDIQHDRAGYYICWGCLVWVPSVYTSQALYLTEHGPAMNATAAWIITLLGIACIYINYDSDNQRYVFRATNGTAKIWGRIPRKIVATYYVEDKTSGQKIQKQSLLLVDGYWKLSRHFHYVPEILASYFWTVPTIGRHDSYVQYFYVLYLTILLTDRAFRDDDRCLKKYGNDWKKYCQEVPYMIVPGIV